MFVYFVLYLFTPSTLLGLGYFLSVKILCTLGRSPWMGDQPMERPLSTLRTIQILKELKQISMPRV